MDDVVILGDNPTVLRQIFDKIVNFSHVVLGMSISKWQISPISRGINFLGYRIWPTHKLLRKDSVMRAKRKIAWFLRHNEYDKLNRFISSWRGHAQWADTTHLFKHLENRYGITS